ncbi:hypothetical protein [Flavobacterium sp. U410]
MIRILKTGNDSYTVTYLNINLNFTGKELLKFFLEKNKSIDEIIEYGLTINDFRSIRIGQILEFI